MNSTTTCYLDAIQIKQQCLGKVQDCKNVEAMEIGCLNVVLVHFLIVLHIFCEWVLKKQKRRNEYLLSALLKNLKVLSQLSHNSTFAAWWGNPYQWRIPYKHVWKYGSMYGIYSICVCFTASIQPVTRWEFLINDVMLIFFQISEFGTDKEKFISH